MFWDNDFRQVEMSHLSLCTAPIIHDIMPLLHDFGDITGERASVLEVVKKETVNINMYGGGSPYGASGGEVASGVNGKGHQSTEDPFPELLRAIADTFRRQFTGSYPEMPGSYEGVASHSLSEMPWELQLSLQENDCDFGFLRVEALLGVIPRALAGSRGA